jgi:predicted transcriptional regulator YdeE
LTHNRKYDTTDENGDQSFCVKNAWEKVWRDTRSGAITRAYTEDYESSVPSKYATDRKTHCYLYIAVK